MSGLYTSITADIEALWTAGWSHAHVPVFWRSDDLEPLPDPLKVAHFFRNEIDFGRETVIAFGAGAGRNERAQFGSVAFRVFTARSTADETAALELLHDAMAIFRSYRGTGSYSADATLSFIGDGSGFDQGPSEDGNWFYRGTLTVFQYRFRG